MLLYFNIARFSRHTLEVEPIADLGIMDQANALIDFFSNSSLMLDTYLFKFILDICMFIGLVAAASLPIWFNPIYSLLNLILIFCTCVICLAILQLKYLSLVYFLIYLGAITILFLFMLLLLSLEIPFYHLAMKWVAYVNLLISIKLAVFSMFVLDVSFTRFHIFQYHHYSSNYLGKDLFLELSYSDNDSLVFNNLLYTQFAPHLIILGYILLVGLVGSISLTFVKKVKAKV